MRRMRISSPMLRRLSAGIFALVLILGLVTIPASGGDDTGTYRISNYIVTLEPQSRRTGQNHLSSRSGKSSAAIFPGSLSVCPTSNYSIGELQRSSAKKSLPPTRAAFPGSGWTWTKTTNPVRALTSSLPSCRATCWKD